MLGRIAILKCCSSTSSEVFRTTIEWAAHRFWGDGGHKRPQIKVSRDYSVISQVLMLNTVMGFDYQTVSTLVDCPIGTVRSRIFRAREVVSAALAEG